MKKIEKFTFFTLFVCQVWLMKKIVETAKITIQKREKDIEKFKSNYNVLSHWMWIKYKGISLENYFLQHNMKVIAVYGMGDLGFRLCEELEGTAIKILYTIDQGLYSKEIKGIECKDLNEELPIVDAVVVTPFFAYEAIERSLKGKVSGPIISLEDIVYSV